MRIKAAVVHRKSGPFIIEDIEIDEPREDELLVRVAGCGLCHTDLIARHEGLPIKFPGVFGHEGSGIVEKVGSRVKNVKPGDHVIMSHMSCGICNSCRKGSPTHCDHFFPFNMSGVRPDGTATMRKGKETVYGSFFYQSSFASYSLASERNIIKVPNDIPVEILGPMGCGILTGAGGVITSLKAEPGSAIAVFGAGSVGMSAIMGAVVCGCTTIIAVDINDDRLEKAKELGATHAINSARTDAVTEIKKITGNGADYTLECVGVPKILRQAVDSLTVGGKCGLIGVVGPDLEVNLEMKGILDGRTVFGIIMGNAISSILIPQLVALYKQGRFPFDKMITFYPLDQINQAAEDSEKGKTLKAVMRP